VLYNLEERGVERRVLPFCTQHGIALVGYSPFGSGTFPAAGSRGGRALAEIAQRRGTTPRAVALGFLIRLAGTFAIPKAADAAHVRENAEAAEIALDDADVGLLDGAFPAPPEGPLAML
jgi:diketogulonate reductase-like aldo/keto reductase